MENYSLDCNHEDVILTHIAVGHGETPFIWNYPEPQYLQKGEVVKFSLRYKEHSKIIRGKFKITK